MTHIKKQMLSRTINLYGLRNLAKAFSSYSNFLSSTQIEQTNLIHETKEQHYPHNQFTAQMCTLKNPFAKSN